MAFVEMSEVCKMFSGPSPVRIIYLGEPDKEGVQKLSLYSGLLNWQEGNETRRWGVQYPNSAVVHHEDKLYLTMDAQSEEKLYFKNGSKVEHPSSDRPLGFRDLNIDKIQVLMSGSLFVARTDHFKPTDCETLENFFKIFASH